MSAASRSWFEVQVLQLAHSVLGSSITPLWRYFLPHLKSNWLTYSLLCNPEFPILFNKIPRQICIVTDYRLGGRGSIPDRCKDFYLLHNAQPALGSPNFLSDEYLDKNGRSAKQTLPSSLCRRNYLSVIANLLFISLEHLVEPVKSWGLRSCGMLGSVCW
jgi:hypothetical protein